LQTRGRDLRRAVRPALTVPPPPCSGECPADEARPSSPAWYSHPADQSQALQDDRDSGADAHDTTREGGTAQVGPFRPAWWTRGRHRQTAWTRLVRRAAHLPICRARWTTTDGDFLDLDFMDGPVTSPQLLVIHGLEGSSDRPYVRGLLALAAERGWRGVAMNFRGCSGSGNRTPRLYHSGDSGDLDWVISELVKRDPAAPVLPVGISLGGNVLLSKASWHPTRCVRQSRSRPRSTSRRQPRRCRGGSVASTPTSSFAP